MARNFFLKTRRTGFSIWEASDIKLAKLLWGNPEVTRYICASEKFSEEDISNRLKKEVENHCVYQVQYWPFFTLDSNELIGCGHEFEKAPGVGMDREA